MNTVIYCIFEFSSVFVFFFFFFANEKLGGIHLWIHFTKNFKGLGINLTKGIQPFFSWEKNISSY